MTVFQEAFIKRAQEAGLTVEQAQVVYKQAAVEQKDPMVYRERRQNLSRILNTLIGGGLGAGIGALTGDENSNTGLRALTGAGIGGGLGYGYGTAKKKYQDYTGVADPWNNDGQKISPSMLGAFQQGQR